MRCSGPHAAPSLVGVGVRVRVRVIIRDRVRVIVRVRVRVLLPAVVLGRRLDAQVDDQVEVVPPG